MFLIINLRLLIFIINFRKNKKIGKGIYIENRESLSNLCKSKYSFSNSGPSSFSKFTIISTNMFTISLSSRTSARRSFTRRARELVTVRTARSGIETGSPSSSRYRPAKKSCSSTAGLRSSRSGPCRRSSASQTVDFSMLLPRRTTCSR